MKYYFEMGNPEHCYTLDYFKDRLADGETGIILELAKRVYGSDFMWCTENGAPLERGISECGILCSDYNPCNGKSGRCRFLTNCLDLTGEKFILTKEGLKKYKPSAGVRTL